MIQKLQCLITALKAESEPFINHFKLEKDSAFDFPFFINQRLNVALIGVGVGKKKIESRIYDFLKFNNHEIVQFINIGIAGGKKNRTNIGELFLINEIHDDNSTHKYYPDILIDHGMTESSITTVENPIYDGGEKYDTLVDMEAHEIFSICSKFVPIHDIAIIKLVSDHMYDSQSFPEPNFISELFVDKMEDIVHFINQFRLINRIITPILSKRDKEWLTNTKKKYLLTASQLDQLVKYVKGFRLRNLGIPLPEINIKTPESKLNQKSTFNTIREKLKT